MANPTVYELSYDFSAFAALNPSTPLPGTQVDIQFHALEETTNETIAALADVRRSDGALKNGIVTPDSLSAGLVMGFTVEGEWAEDHGVYDAADGVAYGTSFYKARVQHTATSLNRPDLDTATWAFLFTFDSVGVGDNSITTGKLVDGAVTEPKIGIVAAAEKTSPAAADLLMIVDSTASNLLKKLTFANLQEWVRTRLGAMISASGAKSTPVDADQFAFSDSELSNASAKLSWANLKAGVWTALGALVNGGTAKTTPISSDLFAIADSAASNASRKLTFANLRTAVLTDPSVTGTVREDVHVITDGAGFAIDPTNGSIQTITLGASRTPVAANFDDGEGILLMVNDGTAYTITWTTVGVVWIGGSAPTLATTGWTHIVLFKVGGTIYGKHVGNSA